MSSDYPFKWQRVENSVADRLLDDSLLHTLNADKKIRRITKIRNQMIRKSRGNLRDYKKFFRLMKRIGKSSEDNNETDDESILNDEAYQKLHRDKSKTALRTFLRLCTRTEKHERPQKSKRKSLTLDSKKPNKSPSYKHFLHTPCSKTNVTQYRIKSTGKTSISGLSRIKLSKTKGVVSSLGEEKTNETDIRIVDKENEKNSIEKIVKDLVSSNIQKKSIDKSLDSDSDKIELAAVKDDGIVENLTEEPAANRSKYDVADRSKSCFELDDESEVLNNQKQDSCNFITDATDDPNAPSGTLSNTMTDDEILGLKGNSNNRNKHNTCIDNSNHDSGNNSFEDDLDEDVSRKKYENISYNRTPDYPNSEITFEHYFTMSEDNSIPPDDILEFEMNGIKLNGVADIVNSNAELSISQSKLQRENSMKEPMPSDSNLDSEASQEILLAAPICYSQLERHSSTESTAKDIKNKLEIRTIEHYNKRCKIISKYQLDTEKNLMTVNNTDNKVIENQLPSEDEQPLRSRKSSKSKYLNQLVDHEDSTENKSTENELLSDNKQLLRESAQNCNLSQNVSQHLDGSFRSNQDDSRKCMTNKSPLEHEEKTKGNESFQEDNISEIQSHRVNRSLNSSFSSFSARSYDENFKNTVKTQLLSEIEQRLRDCPSPEKKESSCTLSQTLNGLLYDETENSLLHSCSSEEGIDNASIDNQLTIGDNDAQSSKSNESIREFNSPKIQPPRLNRFSDIEDSLLSPKSTPIKRRISGSDKDDHLLEDTPCLSKLPRLHKQSTNGRSGLISCERKSQESISHELQTTKSKDDSVGKNNEGPNASKNVQPKPKKRPRPRNLEDFAATEKLTQDTTKPHFRLKDMSDDDEIWIMEVPKTIDPKDLENQTILLGGKSEFTLGDDYYKISSKPSKGRCNISCIFAKSRRKKQYKIANIESKGSIKFRRKYNVIPKTEFVPSKVTAVPFPKNLKKRHPLFGVSYEDKI